jgi:hypothetical protein
MSYIYIDIVSHSISIYRILTDESEKGEITPKLITLSHTTFPPTATQPLLRVSVCLSVSVCYCVVQKYYGYIMNLLCFVSFRGTLTIDTQYPYMGVIN